MQQPHRIIYFSSILALLTACNAGSDKLQNNTDQALFSLPNVEIKPLQRSTTPLAASSNTASKTVTEANTTNYFELSLSTALSIDATVSYTTKDGTAKAGSDYVKKSDTATIRAGKTSVLIGIDILEDTAVESSETFSLIVTNPTGGTFGAGVTELSATHTILDNDSSINGSSGLSLSSTAFKNTGSDNFVLPLQYTCDGTSGGTSPTLSWSNIPSTATHLVLTMSDGTHPNFTLFNIATSNSTLSEGSLILGTMATGDNASYVVPCGTNGDTTTYTFTLYAISSQLSLDASATQAQVISAANDVLVEKTTLVTQRTRRANHTSYAPSSGITTCTEKTADFNQYSRLHRKLECDEANNKMSIISYIGDGLKTAESKQQVQVGITSWIGRLALPTESGHSIKITPRFLTGVNNNLRCDGVETLGITVDGQTILPYYKQARGGNSAACGPTDGSDYSGRDTVVLGEVDQCYGHSPNGEGYHMHGAPICLMDVHDPSKPIAYMTDGIPLYFGEGGGKITDTTHGKAVGNAVTQINYGGGLYEHLSYLPTDRALNDCNAYDINGDGAVSGYVYYTTKDAPYAIGCYMGEAEDFGNPGAENTRYPQFITKEGARDQREGWLGQFLGEPMKGEVLSNTVGTFNGKTYNITDFAVTDTNLSFLSAGNTAQVLWRVTSTDNSSTCFEFRYRKDKNDTNNDETETICSDRAVPSTTLDFTPFG